MSRRDRLRRDEDFQQVRREGRAWHHKWMSVSAVPNALAYNRYGFITSKKVGNAVQRNRIRRRLRELVRAQASRVAPGHDIVIIARIAITEQSFSEIGGVLMLLLQRARLWVESDETAS